MRARLLLLLPFLVVFIAYTPGLSGPWLFDDISNIVSNEALDGSFTQSEAWRESALSMPSGPLGRTVSGLSFALQSATTGVTSGASKAINLCLHLGCGLLIFLLAKGLLLSSPKYQSYAFAAALMASLIWMLSPLHVSTVLYSVQRMAQLSTLFCLGGLLVFVGFRRSWMTATPSLDAVLACALWVVVFTFLGAHSKENGALLPWLIALLEVTWFGGVVARRENRRVLTLGAAALFGPLLVAALLIFMYPDWLYAGYEARDFSIAERGLTQLRLLWLYAYWFIAPVPGQLGLFHDDIRWSLGLLNPVSSMVAGAAWALAIFVALRFAKQLPLLAIAVGWWCIGHSLESTILPLEMVFEHRSYLPSIGLAIAAGTLVIRLGDRFASSNQKRLLWLLPAVFVVPLVLRAQSWSDEALLARNLCETHPLSVRSCHFYAQTQIKSAFEPATQPDAILSASDRALLARHALLKIHERQPEELVTNVALYLLDSHSVPNSPQVSSLWMPRIITSLESNVLDVTEVKAVAQTLQCVTSGVCVASSNQQGLLEAALLDQSANFDSGAAELIAHYRNSGAPPDELVNIIKEWSRDSRGSLVLSDWQALLYLEEEDYPAFFEEMLILVALDKNRLRYPQLSLVISRALSL